MRTAMARKYGDAGTVAVQDTVFATALDLIDANHREMGDVTVLDVGKLILQLFFCRVDQ
mgnify:CR=1 FL=1